MMSIMRAKEAHNLLKDLLNFLDSQQEQNWSQGIKAATEELLAPDGSIDISGFENARSIYNTMTIGGRGFSEYFVWVEDERERIQLNQKLDNFRSKLWDIFNENDIGCL